MKNKPIISFDESINNHEIYYYLLPKLNEFIFEGNITELWLDFTKVKYITVDSFLPMLRAITVGAIFLRKRQPDFKYSIVDATTPAFMYLYHSGIFNMLSDYCELESEQRRRIEYYLRNYEYNPANKILEFDIFTEYISAIAGDDEEILKSSICELKNNRYVRNKIEALISWKIRNTYSSTIKAIGLQYGDRYVDVVIGQMIEVATNAIVHSGSKSYLYFQQGVYLPKTSAICGKKKTGIFIGVGDVGEGFISSLKLKEDKSYLSEYEAIKRKYLLKNELEGYHTNFEQGIQNLLGIFEAIYYSWHKERETRWYGLHDLINEVTSWGGVITVIYDNCEISFDNFNNYEESFASFMKKALHRINDKYMKMRSRKIPGVQINIEIVGDRK